MAQPIEADIAEAADAAADESAGAAEDKAAEDTTEPREGADEYVSHFMQRRPEGEVIRVYFWVQNKLGENRLAIVGTDPRQTGHFTYVSEPEFDRFGPLRCTNRGEAMAWLRGFGAGNADASVKVAAKLPKYAGPPVTPSQHAAAPRESPVVWVKPEALQGEQWDDWRDEVSTLEDGRHLKRYFLVNSGSGAERLAVAGEDGARRDRRYDYRADEALGGMAFENSREVVDWLNFLLGRMDPARQTAAASGERGGASSFSPRHRKPPDRLTYQAPDSKLSPAAAASSPHANIHAQAAVERLLASGKPDNGRRCGRCGGPGHNQRSCTMPLGSAAPASNPYGPVSMEVQAAFADAPCELLEWVTEVPDQAVLDSFNAWATQLNGMVSDKRPSEMMGGDVSGVAWLPADDVVKILQSLASFQVNLKLLEATQISRPVALLRGHPNPTIAQLATTIVNSWRTTATEALNRANAAKKGQAAA